MSSQRTASPPYTTRSGSRFPSGATAGTDGVNFCIFSRHATAVELLLYAAADSPAPFQTITLDAERNRSFFFWHVFVEGLPIGTCYTWRMDGPSDTAATGRRFYRDKELLDPWAHAVSDALWNRGRAVAGQHPEPGGLRAVVVEPLAPLPTPMRERRADLEGAVIYELHVGGFTRHPSAAVTQAGCFAALKEKIPYLQALGVTHVELLPVMAFPVSFSH